MPDSNAIGLGWTGASGICYGFRLLESLIMADKPVWLVYTKAAQLVIKHELEMTLPSTATQAQKVLVDFFKTDKNQLKVFSNQDWFSPLASGSSSPEKMIICPCTMGTVGRIASGLGDDLLTRASDVILKESKTLLIVPREAPFSLIHLENLKRLAAAGAKIMPACPGFYDNPQTIEDLVDFVVARILDLIGVQHSLKKPWGSQ